MNHVEEKTHAELGPSGWAQWSRCPGSIPLSEGIVDKGSSYAREGTAAHALLEEVLLEGGDAEDRIGKTYVVEGDTFTVDMEMADAVNESIAHVRQVIDVEAGDILMAEQMVPIGHLTGETGAEGTSDIVGVTDGGKTLVIADFKYGKGVTVWASEYLAEEDAAAGHVPQPNGQLAMYALGALEKFGLIYDEIERVKLMVLQPRCQHFDSFELSVDELRAFGDEVTLAAGRVMLNKEVYREGNQLDLVPGEKQCKFCKAKAICPALKEHVAGALQTVSSSDITEFEDLTLPKKASSVTIGDHTDPERLAEFMRAAPLIEDAIKAVRAEVERRLMSGLPVPGYKLVEGRKGNRAWNSDVDIGKELTKSGRLKADEAYEKTPISPTKAEKLLKDRPKVWSKIAAFIDEPKQGKPSVAPESDKRPAISLVSDAAEFEDLSLQPEGPAVLEPPTDLEDLMDGDTPAAIEDLMA